MVFEFTTLMYMMAAHWSSDNCAIHIYSRFSELQALLWFIYHILCPTLQDNVTPLMAAVSNNAQDLVGILIQNGAYLDVSRVSLPVYCMRKNSRNIYNACGI